MAAPRLPFLYPNLMRAVRSCEPGTYRSAQFPARSSRHGFHTSLWREQDTYQRRYGPAVEPNLPPPLRPNDPSSPSQPAEGAATGKDEANMAEQKDTKNAPPEKSPPQSQDSKENTSDALPSSTSDKQTATEPDVNQSAAEPDPHEELATEQEGAEELSASAAQPSEAAREDGASDSSLPNQGDFEHVYHLASPSSSLMPTGHSSNDGKPHLTPGPYVHNFDTYSLVQDLSKGGFTGDQSVTIMKAVRNILQNNLDFAKEHLTSKSDVENESYLFKAACSELQASIQMSRSSEMQRQRTSRTQLQHEIDILSQRLNQELAGMKDDIKGMFNDHSMATREQQRSIDTSVQELNYKITVSLNSDGKSEIEGLRWILTRRAALTIATCAFMIIVFLKYASTRKVPDSPKNGKEVEVPVAKEMTKETRIVHDAGTQTDVPSVPEAHLSESLG